MAIVVSMMVMWAAKTDRVQKLLGFNFIFPPPTTLPLDTPSPPPPHTSSQQHEWAGQVPPPFQQENDDILKNDEPTSEVFSKWDKVSHDVAELEKMGVAVWRGDSDGWSVMCESGEVCWRAMVTTHWPKLLEHYGYSTKSRYMCTCTYSICRPHSPYSPTVPLSAGQS